MDASKILSGLVEKVEPLFSSVGEAAQSFSAPLREKLLLIVNHVVAQNHDATERLKSYAGRTVVFESALWSWPLVITPAGLFEEGDAHVNGRAASSSQALMPVGLRIKMKTNSPIALVETLLKEGRPLFDLDGDADLAAVFAWLSNHLHWDYERDFSAILGDSPAPLLVDQLKISVDVFRSFLDAVSEWLNDKSKL